MISVPLENRTKKRNNKLQMSLMPEAGSFKTPAWGKHLDVALASTLSIPLPKPGSERDLFLDRGCL